MDGWREGKTGRVNDGKKEKKGKRNNLHAWMHGRMIGKLTSERKTSSAVDQKWK